jgi:hypothetical protein
MLDARRAQTAAPAVAAILREEGVVDPRLDDFLRRVRDCLPSPQSGENDQS